MTENEREFVKDKILDVYEIEVQKSYRQPEKVQRVRLRTNIGTISYRPFRNVHEKRDTYGFTETTPKQELLSIEELPKPLWELKDRLKQGSGFWRVKLSYFLWNKKMDGEVVPRRYMRDKQINEMEFLEIEEKVK